MNPMQLRCKENARIKWIDASALTPSQLCELSLDEIIELEVQTDHGHSPLGDLFDVVDGQRDEIHLETSSSVLHHVGGKMSSGRMTVCGDVGDYLASNMAGGQLTVQGSAGDFAFSTMAGGTVVVEGDCGDYTSGSTAPMNLGMQGGVAVVEGNVGQWAASRMRRGTLLVHGNLGQCAASRMIAGTLVVCGRASEPIGAGMRRGSIIFMSGGSIAKRYVGFTEPENSELSFLPLLLKSIANKLPEAIASISSRVGMRSIGDRTTGGLAELIWLETEPVNDSHIPAS